MAETITFAALVFAIWLAPAAWLSYVAGRTGHTISDLLVGVIFWPLTIPLAWAFYLGQKHRKRGSRDG